MVTPGKSASAPVVLYNRSTKADVYYLELNGIPNEWTVNRPQIVSVPANGQKEISLVGEEIERRTDPLRRDTDGDGIEDAVDTDP